ncbi:putative acyltransferase OS=Streptomyces microflavus OX=1919 GN=metX PE=3 SV=1 [Streptomyces microflavus]
MAPRPPHFPSLRPPASGGRREGDPPGRRRWAAIEDPLPLESGVRLPGVRLAYETWGQRAADGSNAVLVLHALTGDSHAAGPAGPGHPAPGWWDPLVGPGRALDTDRWFVVAPNVLGGCQGSTGPSSPGPDGAPWGSRFPYLTVRDQVAAEAALADVLGIGRWAAVVGGSMGGMRALEWAVSRPERTGSLLVLAAPAAASAEQIAWGSVQIGAIRSDPGWRGGDYHGAPPGGGPHRGLGQARAHRPHHVPQRARAGLPFGGEPQPGEEPGRGGRYRVESYLDHHATMLTVPGRCGAWVALAGAAAQPRTPRPVVTVAVTPPSWPVVYAATSAAVISPAPGPLSPSAAAISARWRSGSRRG